MEEIHKSFSKNDMIELIEVFKMDIDYFDITKTKLSKQLLKYINNNETFIPNIEYFINNKKELVDYLSKPNQIKVSTYQKKEIMYIAKNILLYCKQGCFHNTSFIDEYEMIECANYIKFYGDIPTVRRALITLNKNYTDEFEIHISPKIKFELDKKKKMKKQRPIVTFKYGKFTLFEKS
jgi:hypothetical protein